MIYNNDARNTDGIRLYKYSLNDNCNLKSISLELKVVSKSKPYESRKKVEELQKYVRTLRNPDGILDLDIYNPVNPENPISSFMQIYNVEELMAMDRSDLVNICESFQIDSVRKKKEKLIQDIIQEVQVLKKSKKVEEEKKVEEAEESESLFDDNKVEEKEVKIKDKKEKRKYVKRK